MPKLKKLANIFIQKDTMSKRVCYKCKAINKSSAKICSNCQNYIANKTNSNSSYINRNLGYDLQACTGCGKLDSIYGKLCPSCNAQSEKPPHY